MDQWLMWAVSGVIGMVAAYGTFRITTEQRLTALEAHANIGATAQQLAVLQGKIDVLAADQAHRKEMFERMDKRLEQIAERVGVP